MKSLNTPRSTVNTSLPLPVKLFPPTEKDHVNTRSSDSTDPLTKRNLTANRSLGTDEYVEETTSVPNFRQPLANIPKLPPQQILCPKKIPLIYNQILFP